MVHSRADLAHIGEANAEFQQAWKFMRLVSARRDADLVDRAPKAIAGMGVVMAFVGRPPTGSGADEHQSQMILKLVRKVFHRLRPFRQSGECRIRIAGRRVANERGGFRENGGSRYANPVHGAAGAGLAVGGGARDRVLTNQKGAVLELSGPAGRADGQR